MRLDLLVRLKYFMFKTVYCQLRIAVQVLGVKIKTSHWWWRKSYIKNIWWILSLPLQILLQSSSCHFQVILISLVCCEINLIKNNSASLNSVTKWELYTLITYLYAGKVVTITWQMSAERPPWFLVNQTCSFILRNCDVIDIGSQ